MSRRSARQVLPYEQFRTGLTYREVLPMTPRAISRCKICGCLLVWDFWSERWVDGQGVEHPWITLLNG